MHQQVNPSPGMLASVVPSRHHHHHRLPGYFCLLAARRSLWSHPPSPAERSFGGTSLHSLRFIDGTLLPLPRLMVSRMQ